MNFDVKWHTEPFPHAVIDDFLPKEDFKKLQNSLKKRSLKTKKVFETPIENKTIFTNENIGQPALDLIDLLSSKLIKEKFADLFGEDVKILSMGEAKDLGGLSPYHETKFAGYPSSNSSNHQFCSRAKHGQCFPLSKRNVEFETGNR